MDYRGLLGLDPRVSGREQPSFYRDVEGEFDDIQQGLLGVLPIGGAIKMGTGLLGRSKSAEKELLKRWADRSRKESNQRNKDRAGFTQGNRRISEKGKKLKMQRMKEEARKASRYSGPLHKEHALDDLRKSTAGKSLLTRLQGKNDLLFREQLRRQGHLSPATPEEAIQLQKLLDYKASLPIHTFQGGPTFMKYNKGLLDQ